MPPPCHHPHADLLQPSFFFFNDTATTEIYTLSLHDALPICSSAARLRSYPICLICAALSARERRSSSVTGLRRDRKSTRLNSSHSQISYAVFCLKKKECDPHHHPKPPAHLPPMPAHPDLEVF